MMEHFRSIAFSRKATDDLAKAAQTFASGHP
jgi:hypothetical protein